MQKQAMLVFLLISSLNVFASRYEDTIPPELLQSYNQDIVSGYRPLIKSITQSMLFGLRDHPHFDADIFTLNIEIDDLSTSQLNIIPEWVKSGNNVLLWGEKAVNKYAQFFAMYHKDVETGPRCGSIELTDHPVNTGVNVKKLNFVCKTTDAVDHIPWNLTPPPPSSFVFVKLPADSETVVKCVTLGRFSSYTSAGRISYGKGNIYFAIFGDNWEKGPDSDRWTLNFFHWMLGYPIPAEQNKDNAEE